MTSVSSKETFLRVWDREFRTTMNVFRSFPDAGLEAKPHGQLTIYLRQVGGKVPSIYGRSGDQPVPAY